MEQAFEDNEIKSHECEIRDSHGGDYEEYYLMVCDGI
jgi:hypothetical protein